MAVDLGAVGVWRRVGEITPNMAAEAERLGYGAVWVGGSPSGDLGKVEEIIEATSQVPVVTGIVNMWREDADTVGHSYLRIAERHPGRFFLGVGVGHPESTSEYENPLGKIRSYLDRLTEVGVPPGRVVLAALGPKVLTISAERTAGAHPYLTTHRHTRFARETMGSQSLLAPEQKIVLDKNTERARDLGRSAVSRYLRLVNYRNNLLREGWSEADLEDGGSDRLVDELVLHGDIESIAAGIRLHLAAGADHVCVQAMGSDPLAEYRALAEALL